MGREEKPSSSLAASADKKISQLVAKIIYISTRSIACVHTRNRSSHFIDCYSLLAVEEDAEINVIRKQYHTLALQLHPDKNKHSKAEVAFKLVHEAYTCLSDTSKRKAFDLERWKNFCRECNRIPYVNSDSPANFHAPKQNTNWSRSRGNLQDLRDIRDRFKEEASVIENCLRATALSKKESPIFNPGNFLDRRKSQEEYPVFNPSDYVYQGYPHIRAKIYDKPEKNLYFQRRNGVNYEQRRGSCDYPVFEHRQEIRMYKSKSTCVYS